MVGNGCERIFVHEMNLYLLLEIPEQQAKLQQVFQMVHHVSLDYGDYDWGLYEKQNCADTDEEAINQLIFNASVIITIKENFNFKLNTKSNLILLERKNYF